ncbi:hypothetical protein FRB95_009496 [Tulasnella sp. JGI-2019a]|nr:hypothetical protein FRB95_009496 [Tulasnella sp. JGI-2019a]
MQGPDDAMVGKAFNLYSAVPSKVVHYYSRVKVVEKNGMVHGYLPPPTPGTHSTVTTSMDRALIVDVSNMPDTQQDVIRVRMVSSSSGGTPHPFLGLQARQTWWDYTACEEGKYPSANRGTYLYKMPRPPNRAGGGAIFKRRVVRADTPIVPIIASSKVWKLKKLDAVTEAICPEWMEDTGATISLQPMLRPSRMALFMYRDDYANYKGDDEPVVLILERV